MDSYRYSLVEQVMMLTKKMKMDAHYIEQMPRLERIKALNIVNSIIEQEQDEIREMKAKSK